VATNEVKLSYPDVLWGFFNYWVLATEAMDRLRSSEVGGIAHACEFETSLYCSLDSERVNQEMAIQEVPTPTVKGGKN